MKTTPLYTRAFEFLTSHENEHLARDSNLLIARSIKHLIDTAGVSHDTARDTTMAAFGEMSARGRRDYIDCSRTTSYALFLVNADGKQSVYTLAELVRMIDLANCAA